MDCEQGEAAGSVEFEATMAAAGITVPPEWVRGTLVCYLELRAMSKLMEIYQRSEIGPSNVLDLRLFYAAKNDTNLT